MDLDVFGFVGIYDYVWGCVVLINDDLFFNIVCLVVLILIEDEIMSGDVVLVLL